MRAESVVETEKVASACSCPSCTSSFESKNPFIDGNKEPKATPKKASVMAMQKQSSGCGHDHSDIDAANKRNYQDWLQFYNELTKLIHKLEPKKNIEGTFIRGSERIATNASAQFRDQINKLTVYESNGKEHVMRGVEVSNREPIPHHPERVVAHIAHLEVEYKQGHNATSRRIEARGFKHDLHASDLKKEGYSNNHKPLLCESLAHMSERAMAAFSMAYMAKAQGWEKVNFADTSDPIDRAMLIQACNHLGVDYGDETIDNSVVAGVNIAPIPTDIPLLDKFQEEVQKTANERKLDFSQHGVEILCEHVFILFLKHPDMNVDENIHHYDCGDGPAYDVGRNPFPQTA